MRQNARVSLRVIFAVSLIGLLPPAESARCEDIQPPFASAAKAPGSPEGLQGPEHANRDAAPDGAGPFRSLAPPMDPLAGRDRAFYYLNRTFGVSSLLGIGASSVFRQATNSVPEWGDGMDGYSAQYASSIGRRLVRNSIDHGLSALFGGDPRYHGSGRSGFWRRSLYAAGQTLVTHTESGKARFAYEHALGTVGSVLISRHWYPENRQRPGDYLSSAAISIGVDAAGNVFREFWPDIKHHVFRR